MPRVHAFTLSSSSLKQMWAWRNLMPGLLRYVYWNAMTFLFVRHTGYSNLNFVESGSITFQPQDAYGLEKLATEELCKHYTKDFGIECRVGRFHNIYGPFGTWKGKPSNSLVIEGIYINLACDLWDDNSTCLKCYLSNRWSREGTCCLLQKGPDIHGEVWNVGWWSPDPILHFHRRVRRGCSEVCVHWMPSNYQSKALPL